MRCDEAQIQVDKSLPAGPRSDELTQHLTVCAACQRHAQVAAASLKAFRGLAAAAAPRDVSEVRQAALARSRRVRVGVFAVLCGQLVGSAALLLSLGPWWALAFFAVAVPPPALVLLYLDVRHRALVASAIRDDDLFAALRAELVARVARVRWTAPLMVIGGLSIALVTSWDLPHQSEVRNVLAGCQFLFAGVFVAVGVYLLTRLPGLRRTIDELESGRES